MESRVSKLTFVIFSVAVFSLVGWWVSRDKNSSDVMVTEVATTTEQMTETGPTVPSFLTTFFPGTDYSNADPSIYELVGGGPPRDSIPALNEPRFVSVRTFDHSDATLAVVIEGEELTKVYPYNILVWHQIVNDEIEGTPVSVTLCPLSDSVAVFKRRLPGGLTTFGVTGGLIGNNMVMFDRNTESLWQQNTGVGLAGVYVGEQLSTTTFKIMTVKEVKELYPDALLLSEQTGYNRDYGHDPYHDF